MALEITLTTGSTYHVTSISENHPLTFETLLDPEQPFRIGKHFVEVIGIGENDEQVPLLLNTSTVALAISV